MQNSLSSLFFYLRIHLRYNKVVQHDAFLYFSYSNQETKWLPGAVLVLMLLKHQN